MVGASTPLQPQSRDLEAKPPDVAAPAPPRHSPLLHCKQKKCCSIGATCTEFFCVVEQKRIDSTMQFSLAGPTQVQ